MSASVVTPEAAGPSLSYQPFQCHICQSRFTRHENLKRHAAVHSRSPDKTSFPCDFCKITLSRRDLYHRHMKRKHADRAEGWAADGLQHNAGIRRERRQSSRLRGREGLSTSPSDTPYSPQTQQLLQEVEDTWVGRVDLPQTQQKLDHHDLNHAAVSGTKNLASTIAPTSNVAEPNHSIASWLTQELSMSDSRQTGLFEQYSTNFGQSLPLKSASLDVRYPFGDEMDPAITLQPIFTDGSPNSNSPSSFIPDGLSSKDMSYLSDNWFPSPSQTARGYQLYFTHISHFVPFLHRPTFDATEISPHLGLSMLCLAYQYGEDPDCGEQAGSGAGLSLRCFHRARVLAASEEEMSNDLLQTITLVQAYWLLQVYAMMYLCGEYSKYGLKLHSRMISLARFGGLTQSIPVESTETEDLDALWLEFIKAESHKRTLLAVHQIDALWYQLFSIPRSLSHLEIKHDLPCREELWTAISSAQWAHRQLAARGSAPLVPYSDAVRLFLSPELDIDSLPAFDLYGAINVTQFLLSSAREVSGWSTMTGRLSLERFEPLRSSLLAMERLIRPQAEESGVNTCGIL